MRGGGYKRRMGLPIQRAGFLKGGDSRKTRKGETKGEEKRKDKGLRLVKLKGGLFSLGRRVRQ